MREAIRSDDDVAVEAAKEKLATLTTRPGYEQAMQPAPSGSRTARAICLAIALGLGALAIVTFRQVDATWLAWLLLLLFSGLALVTAFAGIGFGPEPAPDAVPAVVVGKRVEVKAESPLHYLELLRSDGSKLDTMVLESVYAVLKAGDVGVAHIKPGTFTIVTAFHRL